MSAVTTRADRGTVHVHGAEISTGRDSLLDYAETLAFILAIAAFVVAAWVVAKPSAGAELVRPDASRPAVQQQLQVLSFAQPGAIDVMQPQPRSGRSSTTLDVV